MSPAPTAGILLYMLYVQWLTKVFNPLKGFVDIFPVQHYEHELCCNRTLPNVKIKHPVWIFN